ncbi:BglG family transcription antiterminator [Staphylococcus coagulans]|uniref:BglG family transcription antiterminator n=1 Tax=Staphylococcus coagulans TaxID=74706 RepID=UPI003364D0DF
MLTNRQYEILNRLMKAEEYISIADLAKAFDRSERTIQYDLEYIEFMEDKLKLQVQRSKSKGIKIKCLDENMIVHMNEAIFPEVHYTKDERQLQILLFLFEANSPVNSRKLSTLVNVSRRTIVDDLKNVTKWLYAHHLNLAYLKNKGFIIEGSEASYRKAYGEVIHAYFKTTSELIRKNLFDEKAIQIIREIVLRVLEEVHYPLFQIAIDGLVIHLLIAIQRVKASCTISGPPDLLKAHKGTDAYEISQAIKNEVEKTFEIHFPESEALFIVLHLLGAKKIKIGNQDEQNDELKILIYQFVERVGAALGVDLIKDSKLLNGLYIHLTPALNRMTYNLKQQNPLKNDIYTQYPELIEVITQHIWIFEALYHVSFSEDEIAYLVIHFASCFERLTIENEHKIRVVLLCGSGIGTSQLLKAKLSKVYPEFDILDAYSLYQIDESELLRRGVEYVITTVPIELSSIQCIKVSPFLDKKDRDQLNLLINQKRERLVDDISEHGFSLREVLKPERLGVVKEKFNRNEAISHVIAPLEKSGIVNDSYKKEIMNQLDAFGAYMVISPHTALVHASSKHVKSGMGMTLYCFQQGVDFQHERYDPVKIVIGLATSHPHIHLNALKELNDILLHSSIRNELLNGNLEGLYAYLQRN